MTLRSLSFNLFFRITGYEYYYRYLPFISLLIFETSRYEEDRERHDYSYLKAERRNEYERDSKTLPQQSIACLQSNLDDLEIKGIVTTRIGSTPIRSKKYYSLKNTKN